jgi:PAS domain S-box-containing protein
MSRSLLEPQRTQLPAAPISARTARRFVTDLLRDVIAENLVEQAQLLTSEIVTNAVLHAGTRIDLSVTASPGWVRIEVRDGSSVALSMRHHADEATTGRGLEIVEILASRWGTSFDEIGKTVWFELGEPSEGSAPRPAAGIAEPVPSRTVRLLNLPPHLTLVTVQRGDTLLREMSLIEMEQAASSAPSHPWQTAPVPLDDILAAAEAAEAEGRSGVDVVVELPLTAAEAAIRRLGLADEAERLADSGELLCPPAVPELAMCRKWLLSQIALQLEGQIPTPWELPDEVPGIESGELDPAVRLALEALGAGVVGADITNHVIYVDTVAAEMLGWDAERLVGQRLTTIIPGHLRQAHLAGYTRLLMSGQPRIIGERLRLPARRKDGGTIEIDLTLLRLDCAGQTIFAATLSSP